MAEDLAAELARRRVALHVLRRMELRLGLDPWILRAPRLQERIDEEGCGAVICAVRLARGDWG
jgi:hypothetical protein